MPPKSCPINKQRNRKTKRCRSKSPTRKTSCKSGKRRSPKSGYCKASPPLPPRSQRKRSRGRPRSKKSPTQSAKEFPVGTIKKGNDGYYKVKEDSIGRLSWKKCTKTDGGKVSCKVQKPTQKPTQQPKQTKIQKTGNANTILKNPLYEGPKKDNDEYYKLYKEPKKSMWDSFFDLFKDQRYQTK